MNPNHSRKSTRHWLIVMLVVTVMILPSATVTAAPFSPPVGQQQVLPDGSIVGLPVTGERGITETVVQIMARERNAPPVDAANPKVTKPWLDYSSVPAKSDSTAPAVNHWPLGLTGSTVGGPLNPQTVGTSFKGVGVSESGYIPPDSMGDVGPTQILMHVNGRIKLFDKAGVADPALDASDATFWASVAAGISDPEVRYDRLSGRWFVLAITIAETVNNKIVLAVSSGPTITSQASFTFYSFNVGTVAPGDAASFCDYPSLGIDNSALYTGCNMFSSAGSYLWSSAFVIRKSSVTSGGPLVATGFTNITAGFTAGPYSPRGVDNDDPCAAEGYIIGADVAVYSRLVIRRVSNPGGTPTLSGNINLTTPAGTNALSLQPARGSTTALDTIDDRLFMASIHQNKITGVSSLWTAQQVEVSATCAPSTATTRRIGARWYEIGGLTGTPSFTQSGTLCTTSGTSTAVNSLRGFIFPTVAETGQGHMALGASFASTAPSPGEYAGVAVAGRLRTDTLGTIQAPTIAQAGLASYTAVGGGRNRWGDYSFTDVDPNDDMTVWTFQEYADSPANNWAVRAVQLLAPAPPPSAPTPASIGQGASSISVNCDRSSGTGEFFDPGPATCGGPAYANHIAASATAGVAVNSITFNSPTQVTLDLDTTGATPNTPSTITITNPDGQSATCDITIGSPLGVLLSDFFAEQVDGLVQVTWETVSELTNQGFNLYRNTTSDPVGELLAYVSSQAPGSTQGFTYTYSDSDVQPGQTYWYWLEDISLSGATTLHGPVSATMNTPTAVTLSGVQANPAAGTAALPWLLVVAGAGVALALGRRR